MSKSDVEFESVMELEQVVAYLENLTTSLKQGVLCLQKGSESVVMNPAKLIKVEIEAKHKKDKCKFSLELSWKNEMKAKEEKQDLIISSVVQDPSPENG